MSSLQHTSSKILKKSTTPSDSARHCPLNQCYRWSIYLAAKILTLEGTSLHAAKKMQELEFLKTIQCCEDINSLPILRDDFFVNGPGGRHLCLVMDLLSTDVSSFRCQFPKKHSLFSG